MLKRILAYAFAAAFFAVPALARPPENWIPLTLANGQVYYIDLGSKERGYNTNGIRVVSVTVFRSEGDEPSYNLNWRLSRLYFDCKDHFVADNEVHYMPPNSPAAAISRLVCEGQK